MNIETILIGLTILVGFYMAWNIGANDVSNAISTSVGSKAVTLKKAIIIAAIFEFCGAYFLGGKVSQTIQRGIVNPEIFTDHMIFVFGMMGALLATALWLHLASFFKLPVSTTHAIVGAVLGFGSVIGGVHAIYWGNMLSIALSWLVTPLLSGFIAYIIFRLLQKKILFALSPVEATKKIIPFIVFFPFCFLSFCLIYGKLTDLHLNFSFQFCLFLSIIIGIIASLISILLLRKIPTKSCPVNHHNPEQIVTLEKAAKHMQRLKFSSLGETHEKASKILKEVNELSKEVREKTEFSLNTSEYSTVEKIFGYMQLISICLIAFAHGTNDVANAIGPVAAVIQTLKAHTISIQSFIPSWILFMGGIGIVIGLSTWGWRIVETIGHKITQLTPTRGFSAELAAALTILLASKMGLPISTTHALVGGILGVGLAKGISALNLRTLRDIITSWIITIPSCAILSILIFYLLKLLFY